MEKFALQDGNIFYVIESGSNNLVATVEAPVKIQNDFDVDGAKHAKQWFTSEYPKIKIGE